MSEARSTIEHMFDLGMLERCREALSAPDRDLTDRERIDLIRGLEELKCSAEAAQATLTADFDASQRAAQAARGLPKERQGIGVAAEVALARRESPHMGQRHVGLARILETELPHTRAAFAAGKVTEWRVTLVARETASLTLADRLTVDQELASDPEHLAAMGEAQLVAEARRIAYRLDPESFVERRRRAEADRRVTLRPAPDVMSQLSALLSVKHGVAVYATLKRMADSAKASGHPRSHGQLMADALVALILGTSLTHEETKPADPDVAINVIVSDRVLLGLEDGEAYVDGHGPVPGDLAREWTDSAQWLRRLYATPAHGELVAMDSKANRFPVGLARFIRFRDRTCRTPWCDAPVRHRDHVRGRAEGGETSDVNGQGLCEACNYAKAAPDWSARPQRGARHTVRTTTPTGHSYTSEAPAAHAHALTPFRFTLAV
jgi:hypothetical protein